MGGNYKAYSGPVIVTFAHRMHHINRNIRTHVKNKENIKYFSGVRRWVWKKCVDGRDTSPLTHDSNTASLWNACLKNNFAAHAAHVYIVINWI